jgi:hypothetical protein
MKKFTQIDYTFENKKYQEKSKNDIYSLIKENINIHLSPINEGKNANLDNINIDLEGTSELVEKINKYVDNKIKEERVRVLESIKSSIATGTLDIRKINEEIDSCICSETCPIVEDEDEVQTEYIDDYDETVDEYTEFVDIKEGKKINFADEFIKLLDEGKAENMSWDEFFDIYNIPQKNRTNFVVESIYKQVKEKRSDLI